MDKERLNYWKTVIKFLHGVLGEHYEIVLHVIDENDIYIGEIVNNHISGRTTNSPLTAFALELINNKVYQRQDFVTNYKAIVSPQNKEVRGSTLFIKNASGQLEGMLCINMDISVYKNLADNILNLANLLPHQCQSPSLTSINYHPDETVEVLSNNIQDIISEIIDPSLLKQGINLSQEVKIDIVYKLHEKGVFQLKGAVSKVAEVLNISEPSVYRYLKKIDAD
ncbi:helix-turn-helix transcriptional regulator [Streptococcus pseudoporcinus]|uniref:DNA-binding protein n=2 Tax=Streptococcus pseudoporcinus TaxID=361101 RepID=A0A4U9ZMA4_9STRE|nr:PAS domain-containing protein [Streptococcus pseudoporcinus]EFR43628.1 YheO-like protein [Streptococcus pseudoporcinus SPIN 20026]EHI65285.1 YheO-like protein [Streptococcus pseudoporcinus LQ 940-04]VEF93729.1 DNA-binding protein [Streptococcus pseudoporcinus]VTS12362.1 DNA-binding protein [Streptococcus pseudoporcinus]VTS42100.1 DNA-binding protein [Streptococcus pseudoporcinus]